MKVEKKIATDLDLEDSMDSQAKSEAYLTLKDTKPNYRNNPTFRLINTNKSEMGRVAKQILQEINMSVKLAFKCNQWKNTTEVINWFEEIENKASKHFIQFDICEYYPSIKEQLLMEALTLAQGAHLFFKSNPQKFPLWTFFFQQFFSQFHEISTEC